METFFKPSFVKDFKKLPTHVKDEVRHLCIETFPQLKSLKELSYNTKQLGGFRFYFRVKLGNYRIGFKKIGNIVEFMRVKHRKDIYKYFP